MKRKFAVVVMAGILALGMPAPASAALVKPSNISFERLTPEDAPRNDASSIVSWNDQADASTYSVSASASGQTTVFGGSPSCNAGSCLSTVSGLVGGVAYTFVVTAISAAGAQLASDSVGHTPHSAPATPVSGSAVAGATGITLTWNALSAAEAGGVPLTGYRISDGQNLSVDVSGDLVETVITNVTQGQSYTFTIRALNQYGRGPASTYSSAVALSAPTAPAAPSINLASTTAAVNWSAPIADGGSSVTGYRVFLLRNGVDLGTPRQVGASTTSAQFTDLTAGNYTVQVSAVNAVGNSARSAASSAVTVGGSGAGGGGGGGGGGGFFPPPAAGPAPISVSPIAVGKGLAVIGADGRAVDAVSTLAADGKSLELVIGTIAMVLRSTAGIQFSAEGKATAQAGSTLEFSASGYEPGSTVVGYLIPTSSLVAASFRPANTGAITLGSTTVGNDGAFTFSSPLNAPAGEYLLQFSGSESGGDEITLAFQATIAGVDAQGLKTWTKRMVGNTQAKMYAKSVVGEGKVTFHLNGKEIAWVRAVDATDPKLRLVTTGPMAGANYLVRTVNLQKGKNVLEIYVDGKRLTRTAYSR